MLVRSWNLYHGNTVPPSRRNYLERMVRLAAEDRPEVLCLQEVPAWALPRLAGWSGMTAVADVAQRPMLGPLPSPQELGRRLTELNPGLLRSAFSGQGNAILTTLELLGRWTTVLNPRGLRRRTAAPLLWKLAWAKERRICQAARLRLPGGQTALVANLHATGGNPTITTAETASLNRRGSWSALMRSANPALRAHGRLGCRRSMSSRAIATGADGTGR